MIHIHHHHHVEARCEVMRRLDELDNKLDLIHNRQETIMTAIDDLKTAIAGFIQEGTSDIAALVAQINTQTNNDPAVVALTQQVTDATTAMHTAFTAATGVPLPAPTPAP